MLRQWREKPYVRAIACMKKDPIINPKSFFLSRSFRSCLASSKGEGKKAFSDERAMSKQPSRINTPLHPCPWGYLEKKGVPDN